VQHDPSVEKYFFMKTKLHQQPKVASMFQNGSLMTSVEDILRFLLFLLSFNNPHERAKPAFQPQLNDFYDPTFQSSDVSNL
jgi:hypothetical protein